MSQFRLFRLCALLHALMLASCSAARATRQDSPEELARHVLIIQVQPDGTVGHAWQRAADFDWTPYLGLARVHRGAGPVVRVSRRPRDCDQEHIDCYRDCMRRRLPSHLNHISRGSGAHGAYCADTCLTAYMDCLEQQQSRPLKFSAADDAVEWLKRHREELLVGTIVVIAGVAFVTLSAGAGLVVLAPVVLLGTAGDSDGPWIAGAPE